MKEIYLLFYLGNPLFGGTPLVQEDFEIDYISSLSVNGQMISHVQTWAFKLLPFVVRLC